MYRSRLHRSLSVVAILVLLTLTACGGVPQAAPVQSEPRAAAAVRAQQPAAPTATQVTTPGAAATNAPTARPTAAPTSTRMPLPPTVISIKPDRGEEQVVSAPVVVTFDQPMDPASTSSAFRIEPQTPGEVKVSGNALTFSPTERLERNKEYRITLTSDATSASGLKLQRDVTFEFVTAGFLDVTSYQPADNATDVTVDSAITVAFNRPVVPLVPADQQAALPQPLVITPTVAGKGEWLNTSMYRFTPAGSLAASTLYTVTVKAGLTDTTGGVLEKDETFSFRTIDPTILRWTPENTLNVPIQRPISVTFSMPMDKASTEAAFSLLDPDGQKVAGTFNWNADATELGFKSSELLKFGARYVASVALTAKAASGAGNLRQGRDFTFETVKLPRVTETVPSNRASTIPPDTGVRISFASPMNPASFVTGTITILPKPTRVMTYYNEYDGSLFIDFAKNPATDYTLTLSGKVADPYGNTLGQDYVLKFRTRDLDPVLGLNNNQQFGTYSTYTNTQAVVLYRNVPEIKFRLYKVDPEDLIPLTGRNYWEAWDRFMPGADDLIREWTRQTTAPRNQSAYLREPLVDEQGNQLPPGVYYLQLGAQSSPNQRPPRQLIVRTDANVTLKASADEALAWVTDLKSGQPLPGVNVGFSNGLSVVRATTDRNGLATAKLPNSRKPWDPLLAMAGDAASGQGSFGVASSNWQDGIGAWEFGLPGGVEAQPYVGYVYTDRPIYRPGQTMYWKAIIRRDNDAVYSLPAPGQPVTVTINDEMGNLVLQQRQVLNPLGAIDGSLELGPDAATGYYYLNVRLSEEVGFGINFQVAEYRKPEYEISAQTDKPEYSQGEQIQVTAEASYFFGGPVKNARVNWVLTAADAPFDYKGSGWYSFTDFEWWNTSRSFGFGGMLSQGTGTTDANGKVTFSVPADVTKFQTSQRFTFDITIQDLNNQAVSTQASAVVHKGEFYIGVAPRGYVLQEGQEGQVDILTVDPQSQPAANQRVEVVLSTVEWNSVREQLEDGNYYWATRAKKTGVFTQTVTTDANGAAVVAWTPRAGGEYKIDATARDAKGNTIRSGAYIWVAGADYVAWRQENNDRIKLVVDKEEYKVGETAEVLIPSPYQGAVKALVTIERGRVISSQVIDLTTNSQVLRLPITDQYVPNAFVNVTIVKGIDATSPAPSFKVGLAQLKVSAEQRQLTVVVRPRIASVASTGAVTNTATLSETLQVAPRSTVTWDVQTLDASGKGVPADVSLALVDKAVLTLAADPSGSILQRFYSQRGLGVQTGLTLVLNIDRLVAQLAADGKGGGGGGGGGGGLAVRTEFPDIALWRASVQTDANGRASVDVTLPDNLTTWVMDARAVTEDTRVGQSSTEVVATKELLLRPVLPRFFTAGDQAEIAGIIHNTTNGPLDVTFNASAQGLTFTGRTDGTATIPAGGTYKAIWPVQTVPDAAEVVVNMQVAASNAKLNDAVQIKLPIQRYSTPEVMGTAGQVEAGQDTLELVHIPKTIDASRGELDINIEPSLAAGMLGGLTYLEHYPYECVEQTTSRFLPNVVTFAALKKLGVQRADLDAKLPQQVGVGLQRIYAKQHLDGGWGWWEKDKSNPTVSAYVVFGLAKARQADFSVDQRVLENGIGFLRRSLKAPTGLSGWELNQQAFTLYALAEAGAKEPNRLGALYEHKDKLGHFGKAYLALALNLVGDEAAPARVRTLLADLSGSAIMSATSAHWEEGSPDFWNMNTDTRTTAIVIEALAKLDPENSLAPNAVRWLMSARKADRWDTTQENAWAIIALTDWMAATGELQGNYDWRVTLNGQSLGEGSVTPQNVGDVTTLRANIQQLLLDQTNAVVISRQAGGQTGAGSSTSSGQLYYTAHLKTYVPVEQVQPVNRGFTVGREYRLADCGNVDPKVECPTISSAKVGDVIQVKVTLVVPHSSYYVIVEDPLPAGAEIVDTSLRTTSQTMQGPEVEQQQTPATPGWWWTPTHVDLRDEKAVMFATNLEPGTYQFTYSIRASLPGAFMTLPVNAYQMYFPEVWGRSAGGRFVVTE